VFPSAQHLAAWAGVCPGSNESAGKRKHAGARKGNRHLKTALCNAATAAARKRGSFFKAKYHSLKAHRGGGRAARAIGHKRPVCIHHMLSHGTLYQDLGEHHAQNRDRKRIATNCLRKLKDLEFNADETPKAP
jgi:hypothetical protein